MESTDAPLSGEDLLSTKLLCKLKGNQLEVVYRLSTEEDSGRSEIPNHYIFAIDVSYSMGQKAENSEESKLDRVKTFAELLVGSINPNDYLSIVTFNHNASACIQKTVMSEDGKTRVYNAIENMKAGGSTDLQKALLKSLEIANSFHDATRDLIILFSDGEATAGETRAHKLVEEYTRVMNVPGRNHRIPLSAMSIGDYKPKLLCKISKKLGSDAFYWLKEDSDFELDMFTPVFLRESTLVTDITTTFTCKHEDVSFEKNKFSIPFLEKKEYYQEEEQETPEEPPPAAGFFDKLRNMGATLLSMMSDEPASEDESEEEEELGNIKGLRYFIHSLPNSMSKHFSFVLNLPTDFKKKLGETVIVDIKTTFLDHEMKLQTLDHELILFLKNMKRVQCEDSTFTTDQLPTTNSAQAQETFNETVAYTLENKQVSNTWNAAKEAFVGIALQQCRNATQNAFTLASQNLQNDDFDNRKLVEEAKKVCQSLSGVVEQLFGEDDPHTLEMQRGAAAFNSQIDSLRSLLSEDNKSKWARLITAESSLSKEMPTTSQVLEQKENEDQLFMPDRVKALLDYVKKNKKLPPFRARGLSIFSYDGPNEKEKKVSPTSSTSENQPSVEDTATPSKDVNNTKLE